MDQDTPALIQAIRHSMYVRAEKGWWAALALVAVGVVASLRSLHAPSSGALAYAVAVVAALAPVLAAFARWYSAAYAARADLCRRAALYHDTLGIELELEELRTVALWPSDVPLHPITTSSPYFSSGATPGPARLAEAIAESAFYTAELARIVALGGSLVVIVVLVAFAAALSGLPALAGTVDVGATLSTGLGVLATVTLSLLLGELLITTLAYRSLSEQSQEIFRSATQFGALANQDMVTAMRLAEAYSVVLASNLPIPNRLYRRHRDRIHRAYQATQPAAAASEPGSR